MEIDITKLITNEEITKDIIRFKERLEEANELFLLEENKPVGVILSLNEFERMLGRFN